MATADGAATISSSSVHILVVDDDPLSRMVLERMLKRCQYKVTACGGVAKALELLREKPDFYNLVISDVYMPDDNGFKLLEVVALEMDMPVIMMSANGETSVVMKGITHGACDYLIKPIKLEELKMLWQHVGRRKSKDVQVVQSASNREDHGSSDCHLTAPTNGGIENTSTTEANIKWSVPLHEKFVSAVNGLGVEQATANTILDIMNVPGLTIEQISSHLEKYKSTFTRLNGELEQPLSKIAMENIKRPNMSMPATLNVNVDSSIIRSSSVDEAAIGAASKLNAVTEQNVAVAKAQAIGGLASKINALNPGGDQERSADLNTGGLFKAGSVDIGTLTKKQDGMTDAIRDDFQRTFREVPEQKTRNPGLPPTSANSRSMVPDPSSFIEQTATGGLASKNNALSPGGGQERLADVSSGGLFKTGSVDIGPLMKKQDGEIVGGDEFQRTFKQVPEKVRNLGWPPINLNNRSMVPDPSSFIEQTESSIGISSRWGSSHPDTNSSDKYVNQVPRNQNIPSNEVSQPFSMEVPPRRTAQSSVSQSMYMNTSENAVPIGGGGLRKGLANDMDMPSGGDFRRGTVRSDSYMPSRRINEDFNMPNDAGRRRGLYDDVNMPNDESWRRGLNGIPNMSNDGSLRRGLNDDANMPNDGGWRTGSNDGLMPNDATGWRGPNEDMNMPKDGGRRRGFTENLNMPSDAGWRVNDDVNMPYDASRRRGVHEDMNMYDGGRRRGVNDDATMPNNAGWRRGTMDDANMSNDGGWSRGIMEDSPNDAVWRRGPNNAMANDVSCRRGLFDNMNMPHEVGWRRGPSNDVNFLNDGGWRRGSSDEVSIPNDVGWRRGANNDVNMPYNGGWRRGSNDDAMMPNDVGWRTAANDDLNVPNHGSWRQGSNDDVNMPNDAGWRGGVSNDGNLPNDRGWRRGLNNDVNVPSDSGWRRGLNDVNMPTVDGGWRRGLNDDVNMPPGGGGWRRGLNDNANIHATDGGWRTGPNEDVNIPPSDGGWRRGLNDDANIPPGGGGWRRGPNEGVDVSLTDGGWRRGALNDVNMQSDGGWRRGGFNDVNMQSDIGWRRGGFNDVNMQSDGGWRRGGFNDVHRPHPPTNVNVPNDGGWRRGGFNDVNRLPNADVNVPSDEGRRRGGFNDVNRPPADVNRPPADVNRPPADVNMPSDGGWRRGGFNDVNVPSDGGWVRGSLNDVNRPSFDMNVPNDGGWRRGGYNEVNRPPVDVNVPNDGGWVRGPNGGNVLADDVNMPNEGGWR